MCSIHATCLHHFQPAVKCTNGHSRHWHYWVCHTGTTGYVVYDFLLLFHSTQAQFYCNLYHSQILAENHK